MSSLDERYKCRHCGHYTLPYGCKCIKKPAILDEGVTDFLVYYSKLTSLTIFVYELKENVHVRYKEGFDCNDIHMDLHWDEFIDCEYELIGELKAPQVK